MKLLFASLLWFFSLLQAHPAPPPTDFDARFLALMEWASELNAKANAWNDHCGTNVEGEGCEEMHEILGQQFAFFIAAAGSYRSEGDDCKAKVRQQFVAHEIRTFSYNLNCVAKQMSGTTGVDCAKEAVAVDAEQTALKKAMDACAAEKL